MPIFTLPKFTGDGVMLNCPAVFVIVVVPVPVRGMFRLALETHRLPPVVPADCGVKVTFTVTLCPTPKLMGKAGPLTDNPPPIACKPEICC